MNKMVNRLLAGAMLLGTIVAADAASATVTVDYSWVSDRGSSNGTVTGTLVFNTTGVGVAATEFYVTSAPAGTINAGSLNQNLLAGGSTQRNAFTVSDTGIVSASDFNFYNGTYAVAGDINNSGNGYDNQLYNYSTGQYALLLNRGFGGTTYTPRAAAASDVPEPASWAMMVAGFGLIGGAMRGRRTTSVRFA